MARQLSEIAINLVENWIQTNIAAALADVRTSRNNPVVTTEIPPTNSYFTYPKAKGYRCPAIFTIDKGMEFRQTETKSNFINSNFKFDVSVKVEDRDQEKLTIKAWRYQAALHEILDQTNLASPDGSVKLVVKVTDIKPSGIYTQDEDQTDSTATFFKEYLLNCEADYYENF